MGIIRCKGCFLFLSALVLGSCFLDPEAGEDVRILFPPVPAEVRSRFGSPSWRLALSGADGRVWFVTSSGENPSVSVRIPPGPAAPIACYMVFDEREDLFFPAGGLYPHDADARGELALTWEKGFAAALLIRLGSQGYPVGAFNAGRFFRETEMRGEGNAWALNEELIITTLATLGFRADRIKLLAAHPVSLSLPPGTWLPRNLLARTVETGVDGICDFGYLTEGYHRYYRLDGGGKADIQVKGRNDILYTLLITN
jgi:hypothetical protein